MKNNATPEVRFEGFEEDWEEKTLGEIGSVVMCKRIFKNETSATGEIPFFKIGTFGKEPDSFISRELFEQYKNKFSFPEIGDILISAAGTIGRSIVYDGEEAYFQDSNIVWLKRDKNLLDNSFLKQFYTKVNWEGLEGSTIKRLYNKNILSTKIFISGMAEQQKIGAFFKNLDETIAIAQKELSNLQQAKKGFLQKMFPKDGAKKPEVRFEGFEEDWEEKTLGEVKDVRDGTHESPKYHLKGYPLITSKNLTQSGLDFSNISLISEKDFIAINKRSKVDIGDILFGMIGTIGNPVIVDRNEFAIKNVALIKKTGSVINEFLLQHLKSLTFEKYIFNENVGNTQKFISLSKIRNYLLLFPSLEEQEKIGEFFKNLDELIAIAQKQLSNLQQAKKGFLQKMFV